LGYLHIIALNGPYWITLLGRVGAQVVKLVIAY